MGLPHDNEHRDLELMPPFGGFRVQGSEFRVQGLGVGIQGSGFEI